MAEETPFIIPVDAHEEEPNGSDPKGPPVEINTSQPATVNHTPDHTPGNASEDVFGDLIMQFVLNDDDLPEMGPWNTDVEGLPERAAQKTLEEIVVLGKPSKKNRTIADTSNGLYKKSLVTNSDFYNVQFTFKETEMNVRDLVASPLTPRIRDYDMPDGLKVPKCA
uniref:Uncharacterized protein n=1 Tax=Tanacetum cinerariifolium TaxID=118510 RepID=A0A6L2N028_TANCI|nr:hypothetical protein [Tanacetum cinerariifolium]